MVNYNSVNGNNQRAWKGGRLKQPFEIYWGIQKYYVGVRYNRVKWCRISIELMNG